MNSQLVSAEEIDALPTVAPLLEAMRAARAERDASPHYKEVAGA